MTDEEKLEKFIQGIIDAHLPMQDEILIALGELWESRERYKVVLSRMSERYVTGTDLGNVFGGGFDWSGTPQGHEWWRSNVKSKLEGVRYAG